MGMLRNLLIAVLLCSMVHTSRAQLLRGNSLVLYPKASLTDTLLIKAPTLSAPWTLTLPTTAGTANYFLQTDGTGITTWALPSVDSVRISDTSIKSHYSDSSLKSDTASFALMAGPVMGEGSSEYIFDFEFAPITGNAGPYNIGYVPTQGTFQDFIITKVVWTVDTSWGVIGTPYTFNLGKTAPNYTDYVNAQPTAVTARTYTMPVLVAATAETAPVALGSGHALYVKLSGAPTITGTWVVDLHVFGYYRSYN